MKYIQEIKYLGNVLQNINVGTIFVTRDMHIWLTS